MFAIAFDLTVANIEQSYSKHPSQAYADIRDLMTRYGFNWTQGSVYLSDSEDLVELTSAMNALKALSWFPHAVRDIRAFRVEQWSNFTNFMKT